MIIGTLPPEDTDFYYSNSPNTRMWDLLKSILEGAEYIPKNSYKLPVEDKKMILEKLKLSMADIISEYERKEQSTKDSDLVPIKYSNIGEYIEGTSIKNLIFVYESALKWFLHSLTKETPVELNKLKKIKNCKYGIVKYLFMNGRRVNCILLPSPLNRGKKGETIEYKRRVYKEWILPKD